ncbi:RAMP superfamily CRISPR-associated protein [Nocardia salmonicida]|uniref:RAMP superfamily CRISPR-associated protein n=1 Tax=Nocardia salmonicida TaxID=53431 RepID=UPI00379BB5BF
MTETVINVAMRFDSDWHVGFGAGRHGAVDRSVVTDTDGLPYIPAKTAVGILRDAAEIAAGALDEGTDGVWAQWVATVFGSQPAHDTTVRSQTRPRAAALTTVPLRLSPATRHLINSLPVAVEEGHGPVLTRADVVRATTVVRAGVRIDAQTGTAVNEALRTEQRARADLTVEGSWTLTSPDGYPVWPALLLLRAAAGLVRQVGGKRRRGAGSVVISLDAIPDLAELKRLFAQGPTPSPWPAVATVGPEPRSSAAVPTGRLVHVYDLIVTVIQPVVVDNGLRGNVVATSTQIPGSMLLPLLRLGLGGQVLADLVRGRQVIVTDACVEVAGERGVAWPRALAQSKDAARDDWGVVNTLVEHRENPRLKPKPARYVSRDCRHFREVEITQGIHAVIADDAQRPNTSTGGLFVYEGIVAGTVLRANIFLPEHQDIDTAAIEGEHRIGRSAKDDYGLVHIAVTAPPPPEPVPDLIPAGKEFTVWAVADLLLRTPRGGPDTSATGVAAALGAALGAPDSVSVVPASADIASGSVFADVCESVRSETTRRHSWQRSWGLPRPSLTAIAASSVFVLVSIQPVTGEQINWVHDHGIGDRTVEGYGRVLINAAALRTPTMTVHPDILTANTSAEAVLTEPDSLGSVMDGAWRAVITRACLAAASTHYREYLRATVSRAQLGNLRDNLADLTDAEGRTRATAWVSQVRASNAVADWGPQVLDRIEKLLGEDPSEPQHPVWPLLFGHTPTDLPAQAEALTVFAVQTVWTEMLRIAARTQET